MKELPDPLAAHLVDPRCVGEVDPPRGRGRGTNEACGDLLEVWVGERAGRLTLRFRAQACAAVVAVASFACERLDGATRDELEAFDLGREVDALGGLPRHRRHALRVFERALAEALADLGP